MGLFDRKPGRLRKLVIDRVDLVDAGANPDAHIMLYKSEDGVAKAHEYADANGSCATCGKSEADHMKKSAEAPEAPEQVNKEAPVATDTTVPEADLTALQDAIDTAVAKALADHDVALAELAKVETPEPTDIDKAELPEPVRKRLEELETVAKADREKVEKLEKAARDSRFADEAKSVSLTAVDAATLDAIEKAAPEAYETLAKALATAQERLEKSDLFRELGSNGDGAGDGSADKLDAIAKSIAADEKIPYHEAYRKAVDANRELAAEAVRAA